MKKSVSFSTVQFIIHPPVEEAYSEPCLSYAPEDQVVGINIERIQTGVTLKPTHQTQNVSDSCQTTITSTQKRISKVPSDLGSLKSLLKISSQEDVHPDTLDHSDRPLLSPACIPLPPLILNHHSLCHINTVSCCYSLAQLIGSLPFIHSELPFESSDPHIHDFVLLIKAWHTTSDGSIVKSMFEEYLFSHWGSFVPTSQKAIEPSPPNSPIHPVINESIPGTVDTDHWFRGLMDHVLFKTRFGRRFDFGLKSLIESPSHTVNLFKSDLAFGPTPISNDQAKFVKEQFVLDIPMDLYSESDIIPLITLLNHRLSQTAPVFFAGGSLPPKPNPSGKRTHVKPPRTQFTNLPGFLALLFHRPFCSNEKQPDSLKYHPPAIELPMEIDLGFYLDVEAPRPQISHTRRFGATSLNASNSSSQDNSIAAASPTFYRLHGFLTQLNGFFMTYTRLRGQSTWFKCTGGTVEEVDLGARVSSRGVMLAIYCLQDGF